MKLAILLVTADRAAETEKTVSTFFKFNPTIVDNAMLLWADDGSLDPRVQESARTRGFELCAYTKIGMPRQGGHVMRREGIAFAAKRGVTHVLILENDWESVRPLPWSTITHVFGQSNIYCLRLYGIYRERDPITGEGRLPCGSTHFGKGRGTYNPNWTTQQRNGTEKFEVGDIHWGAPPAITRIEEAVWLHQDTKNEGEIRTKCAQFDLLTARVVDNVFYHIGYDKTPWFTQ